MPAKSLKAADKQTILKKLVTEMKRRYGGTVPKQSRSVFETLLFAVCLEDVSHADAEAGYAKLLDSFFDLNEIRVSSVSQIEQSLGDLRQADWKAMRVREALQHVFEKYYAFDLEFLRRKTQEQAIKELAAIPYQTPFVRGYVVHHILGAHVLPLDESMTNVLVWLGLASHGTQGEVAGEDLKAGVKKADGVLLCHLLKATSADPELREHFTEIDAETEQPDPMSAGQRLAELFKDPQKKKKKPKAAPAKSVSVKKPVKKAVAPKTKPEKTKPATASRKVTKKVPPTKKSARKRTK